MGSLVLPWDPLGSPGIHRPPPISDTLYTGSCRAVNQMPDIRQELMLGSQEREVCLVVVAKHPCPVAKQGFFVFNVYFFLFCVFQIRRNAPTLEKDIARPLCNSSSNTVRCSSVNHSHIIKSIVKLCINQWIVINPSGEAFGTYTTSHC